MSLNRDQATYQPPAIPKPFITRRLHSLFGLWLSLYIILHLLTNSQAALWIGQDGKGFIHDVNAIQNLPYLSLIEIIILAMPILFHTIWGIQILRQAHYNSFSRGDSSVYMPEPRNRAYTWQRVTAWLLVILVAGHVIHMRFLEHPITAKKGAQHYYMMRVSQDPGLITLAERLDVKLYDHNQIELEKESLLSQGSKEGQLQSFVHSIKDIFKKPLEESTEPDVNIKRLEEQKLSQEKDFVLALTKKPINQAQVIAVAKDFGTAELLMVRDTFKSPFMMVLYTILVLTACYHAFNGLWTFLITWGIALTEKAQKLFLKISYFLMISVASLGLAAVWMTYWINLKH